MDGAAALGGEGGGGFLGRAIGEGESQREREEEREKRGKGKDRKRGRESEAGREGGGEKDLGE